MDCPSPTTSSSSTAKKSSSSSLWLRIIQINDVYQLDSFPSLLNLIRAKSSAGHQQDEDGPGQQGPPPDQVVVVVAGDFLAPYLLSSLDYGYGMIDCLNALGVTHVVFGNHETDIPFPQLAKRIGESNFVWLNTNMSDIQHKLNNSGKDITKMTAAPEGGGDATTTTASSSSSSSNNNNNNNDDDSSSEDIDVAPEVVTTPSHDIVTLVAAANNNNDNDAHHHHRKQHNIKRVGLMGLLTDDPGLYRPRSFGGATIEPVIPCCESFLQQHNNNVDLWIPITHQSIQHDRVFGHHFGGRRFPIVLGGHDHDIIDEVVNGCRIIKAGQNATHAAITDIRWCLGDSQDDDDDDDEPEISVHFEPVQGYQPDPDMLRRVEGHYSIIKELERATLFHVGRVAKLCSNNGDGLHFSTQNNRLQPSTGTTAFCEMLRMGMRCDCALINAGSVRGNRVYEPSYQFTWSDLKDEIPFPTLMTACQIPGRVIEACIRNSRIDSYRQPIPIARGGYLHTCNQIDYDNNQQRILTIQGEPFDLNRSYLVALPTQFFQGIDHHAPLLDWAADNNNYQLDLDSAYPSKLVIVQLFSSLIWLQLGSFDEIDTNHDGVITIDEVRQRLIDLFGTTTTSSEQHVASISDLVVDSIFSVADLNGSGTITPLEMMLIEYSAKDSLSHIINARQSQTLKEIATNVLGITSSASSDSNNNIDGDEKKDEKVDVDVDVIDQMNSIVRQIRQRVVSVDNPTTSSHTDNLNKTDDGDGGSGKKMIRREDVMKVVGELNRKDLLN